jgi:hypothetical protein
MDLGWRRSSLRPPLRPCLRTAILLVGLGQLRSGGFHPLESGVQVGTAATTRIAQRNGSHHARIHGSPAGRGGDFDVGRVLQLSARRRAGSAGRAFDEATYGRLRENQMARRPGQPVSSQPQHRTGEQRLVSLTVGTGPFSSARGTLNAPELPDHLMYWEDWPRRRRAVLGSATILDTRAGKLLHETGKLAAHYNVTDWSEHPVGGHFPAVAEPKILANAIRQFFRPMRSTQ